MFTEMLVRVSRDAVSPKERKESKESNPQKEIIMAIGCFTGGKYKFASTSDKKLWANVIHADPDKRNELQQIYKDMVGNTLWAVSKRVKTKDDPIATETCKISFSAKDKHGKRLSADKVTELKLKAKIMQGTLKKAKPCRK